MKKIVEETGVIFQGWGVRAILQDTKLITRRVRGLEEINQFPDLWKFFNFIDRHPDGRRVALFVNDQSGEDRCVICPYRDKLWVRETWAPVGRGGEPRYKASFGEAKTFKWKPSLHMPRWASRINLDVKDIRVERLHQITELEAKFEGVPQLDDSHGKYFRKIWIDLHGQHSWDQNPWLWVIEFRRKP